MIKIIKLFILSLVACLVLSCSDSFDSGQLRIINDTGDRYNVIVEGYQVNMNFDMEGFETRDMTLRNGMYNIYVKQLNGYLLYPTRDEFSINVTYGNPVTLELPSTIY